MIRLVRPPAPAHLANRLAEVGVHATEVAAGNPPSIKDSIYRHKTVKEALHTMQKGKCAYCEVKLAHHFPRVEHFRPKRGWQQGAGQPLVKPGYWWLAYEWTNLVLSCEDCNERFKDNLFPVAGIRATDPSHPLAGEVAMLIDPGAEDPSPHLGFDEHNAVGLTPRGDVTIEVLGLNGTPTYQANVDERRKDYEAFIERTAILEIYRKFWTSLTATEQDDARTIQSKLLNSTTEGHAYTSMLRIATSKYEAVAGPISVPLP